MRMQKYRDSANRWRWRLLAANNRILADSGEGYNWEVDCDRAIDLIRRFFRDDK
jgi:uncharacterized protein YegP (UPF0339 family)